MNKTKTLLSAIVVSVLAVLGAVLLPSSSAFADESSVDYRLSITPTQKSFGTIKPGETYSDKFKVKNTGREPFDFSISFAPYNVEVRNTPPTTTRQPNTTTLRIGYLSTSSMVRLLPATKPK